MKPKEYKQISEKEKKKPKEIVNMEKLGENFMKKKLEN